MKNWQEEIIREISFNEHICYLINDPDDICLIPEISRMIISTRAILADTDPVALRVQYEIWRNSEVDTPFIICQKTTNDFRIAYDIEKLSTPLDFHISRVLPQFDINVLRDLTSEYFDDLKRAIEIYQPGKMLANASKDFVLRHIYKIAPEIIQDDVDLIRLLLRKHYLNLEIAEIFEERLIELLGHNEIFSHWPLNRLIKERAFFFECLQEQWKIYLDLVSVQIKDTHHTDNLIIPFSDQSIAVYVDNLFSEGLLKPITCEHLPVNHWAQIGVVQDNEVGDENQLKHLLDLLNTHKAALNIQATESIDARSWGKIAHELGVANSLSYKLGHTIQPHLKTSLTELNVTFNGQFEQWMQANYTSLFFKSSPAKPIMLHRIPSWMQQNTNQGKKMCLMVMDGMGFEQWSVIREYMQNDSSLSLDESYCFAWVPTMTSISRQAMFAGKSPFHLGSDIKSTSKEGKHWQAFWKDAGLNQSQIGYKVKAESMKTEEFSDMVSNRSLKVLGLVVNKVDDQMHGMKDGLSGLNVLVKHWCEQNQLTKMIQSLLDADFEIVLTSDHGNLECSGIGRISDGVMAETRGERVRIYDNEKLRSASRQKADGDMIEWPSENAGLPNNVFPLIASGNDAFVTKGESIVGHGGISLHEVIVPLVVITKHQNTTQ